MARDGGDAADALERRAGDRVFGGAATDRARPAALLIPGLGNQHPGMGRGLYETEPVFRETIDRCAEVLRPLIGLDLRTVLYPADGNGAAEGVRAVLDRAAAAYDPAEPMKAPRLGHTALFATQYALARLWREWGVRPEGMMGYSMGEYVAAAVAGVWSLEDALALTAERALLIEQLPAGAVMGIGRPPEDVRPMLRGGLCIFALNGPGITVVAGPVPEVEALQAELAERRVRWRRLAHPFALHTSMMQPVAERLEARMREMRMHAPAIPFVSNVTGTWIRDAEATDPAYWTRHLCGTVRFHEGVQALVGERRPVLLELGSGHGLRMLTQQLTVWEHDPPEVIAALRHGYERVDDVAHAMGTAGRLWAAGVEVDWGAVHAGERPRRVPLPTYPFERRRYWIDPLPASAAAAPAPRSGGTDGSVGTESTDGLRVPAWTRAPLPAPAAMEPAAWLVLADEGGIGRGLTARLEALGHTVAVAEAGPGFAHGGGRRYAVRPGSAGDFARLRDALHADGIRPIHLVHLWEAGPVDGEDADGFARAQARGYATIVALASAFDQDGGDAPLRMVVVTDGVQDVAGGESTHPARSTVLGACLALASEHPGIACRTVDVRVSPGGGEGLVELLLAEVTADVADDVTALRGRRRWALGWQAAPAAAAAATATGIRRGGGYLLTGAPAAGAGPLAAHLAGAMDARLAVVVDPAFPGRETWEAHLASAAPGDAAAAGIHALRAAENRGSEVLLLRAASDDSAALRIAVRQAADALGALHGILHGIALPGAGVEDAAAALAGMDRELDALREATAGIPLDFVVLLHPGAAVPGNGAAPELAAGALADAWAQRAAADGGARWISVEWDGAPGDGALSPEAAAALARLAAMDGEPRVRVAARAPEADARAEETDTAPAEPAAAAPAPALHPRPGLSGAYHPPTNPAEEMLAGVWSQLLGIAQVGIHDDFFHLGGHSLLGMQVVSRVRDAFAVELPLRAVFEAPTVATLAALVEEAIRIELEEMSEDEAVALAGEPVA